MLPHFIPSDLLIAQYSLVGDHPEIPAFWLDVDYHFIGAFNLPPKPEKITTVAVVATGEFAYNKLMTKPSAQIAVASILEVFRNIQCDDILSILKSGVELASKRIAPLETSAVCAAAVITGRKLYITNIGDCRIFLIRDGKIQQISITHTLEETLIENGHVTAEDLESSISAGNSLHKFLGYSDFDKADFRLRLHDGEPDEQALTNQGLELKSNDRIVLCSNHVFGYWRRTKQWQLFEEHFLKTTNNIQETVEQFVHTARKQGAFHTLTVAMVQVP